MYIFAKEKRLARIKLLDGSFENLTSSPFIIFGWRGQEVLIKEKVYQIAQIKYIYYCNISGAREAGRSAASHLAR